MVGAGAAGVGAAEPRTRATVAAAEPIMNRRRMAVQPAPCPRSLRPWATIRPVESPEMITLFTVSKARPRSSEQARGAR